MLYSESREGAEVYLRWEERRRRKETVDHMVQGSGRHMFKALVNAIAF